MVSITLSIPKETRKKMKEFPEMNWSGFIRNNIEEKTRDLKKIEQLKKELELQKDTENWAIKLQRKSKSGRIEKLKKKGLI